MTTTVHLIFDKLLFINEIGGNFNIFFLIHLIPDKYRYSDYYLYQAGDNPLRRDTSGSPLPASLFTRKRANLL